MRIFAAFGQLIILTKTVSSGVCQKQRDPLHFSLHQATWTWQEVLYIGDDCLGQIGHGPIAATGGAIVEKVADSGCWVFLKEIITGTVGFLGMRESKSLMNTHKYRNKWKCTVSLTRSSTWSLRKRSLAKCRIRSTWIIPPIVSMSTSATRPRTITVSTSSCRYSGCGTWYKTDSTCTANLISPAVIYTESTESNTRPCTHSDFIQ